jgi:hypothetical protein
MVCASKLATTRPRAAPKIEQELKRMLASKHENLPQ